MKTELRRTERIVKSSQVRPEMVESYRNQRREYRKLRRSRACAFWKSKIASDSNTSRKMWQTVDHIRGRGGITTPAPFSASDFQSFFTVKVESVRRSTSSAPHPIFTDSHCPSRLNRFHDLSLEEVIAAVHALPNKQCRSDPIPTQLLKDHIEILAPFILVLFNRFLSTGTIPQSFK